MEGPVLGEELWQKMRETQKDKKRRKRTVRLFFAIFCLNLIVSTAFFLFEILEVYVLGEGNAERCDSEEGATTLWHAAIFGLQLVSLLVLLRHSPIDPFHLFGLSANIDTPFSGSSKTGFYAHWGIFFVLTLWQLMIALHIALTCGVVSCHEDSHYCIIQIVFTAGDWLCVVLNLLFIVISWTPAFRKSFPMRLEFDHSLGNPPRWDVDVRPFITLQFRDGAGVPCSLRGVAFECLLINYTTPFEYERSEFVDGGDHASIEASESDSEDETAHLLSQTPARTSHKLYLSEFEVDQREAWLLEPSEVAEVPRKHQLHPHVIRIATKRVGAENHGILQFTSFMIPHSLYVPRGTLLRVRPRSEEDRDLIPLIDAPHDLQVVGNLNAAPLRDPLIDITVSYPQADEDFARAFVAHCKADGRFSVFARYEATSAETVVQHTRYCRFLVVVLDMAWVQDDQCRYEMNLAMEMMLAHNTPLVIPLVRQGSSLYQIARQDYLVAGLLTNTNVTEEHTGQAETFAELLGIMAQADSTAT